MSCYITILSIIFLCTYLDLFMEFDYMMLALASINLLLQCYGQLSFHKPWEKWQDWSWCVERHIYIFFIFFYYYFDNPGCPGQLARTTTIPRVYWTSCKPSRQVRHRGGDMRAHGGSNSGRVQDKPHLLTTELDPQVRRKAYI